MVKIQFSKTEIINLVLAAIVIGFLFSFKSFSINYITSVINWIKYSIFGLVALVIYILAQKLTAKRFNAQVEYRIWNIKRFWFTNELSFEVPLGLILALLLIFLTNGAFIFLAISSFAVVRKHVAHKIGRIFPRVTEIELAKIAVVGPLTSIILVLLLTSLKLVNVDFGVFISMNLFLALYNMIPVSQLDGLKVYIGSRTLFVLTAVFLIAFGILLTQGLNSLLVLILSILTAVVLTVLYFYYREFK